jgi:hypothetical protein
LVPGRFLYWPPSFLDWFSLRLSSVPTWLSHDQVTMIIRHVNHIPTTHTSIQTNNLANPIEPLLPPECHDLGVRL